MVAKGNSPGLFINNIRFYIFLLSLLLSIFIAAYFRTRLSSDALFMIRVQQVYAFTAMALWYLVLLATPLSFIFHKTGLMLSYLFSRRALGVSGAYFACLHLIFGVLGQLGGLSGVLNLPPKFQQAVLMGVIALFILILMAVASFDSVIRKLTYKKWKLLHGLSYLAVVLALLHAWIIGTHLQYALPRVIILSLLGLLVVLESWRLAANIEVMSGTKDPGLRWTIFITVSLIFIGASIYIPMNTTRYHDEVHIGGHL